MAERVYYTMSQLCFLLGGIDPKTLNKRLKAAGIEMEPDPHEPRRLRLSRADAKRLAAFHKITLLDDEALRNDPEQIRTLARLALNVEQVEQTLEEMEGQIEARFAQMQQTLVQHVDQRLGDAVQQIVEQFRFALEEQISNVPFLTEAGLRQVIAEAQQETQTFVQQQIEDLRQDLPQALPGMLASIQPLTSLPSQPHSTRSLPPSSPASSPTSRGIVDSQKRKRTPVPLLAEEVSPGELLPGTVPVRLFAERHGTTRDMMAGAIKREELKAEERPYRGTQKQYFFTPEQQDAAVKYLLERVLPGHRCSNCPHAGNAPS